MIEIVDKGIPELDLIEMSQMRPLQVAQICDQNTYHNGEYVMRTASNGKFEVMSLSKPGKDSCWTNGFFRQKVRLLAPDERITVDLFNG